MAKFRVLSPNYTDADGKVYKRGKVVESDLDLDEMFTGCFERVGEKTRKGRDQVKGFDKDDTLDSQPDRARTRKEPQYVEGDEEEEEEVTQVDAPVKGVGKGKPAAKTAPVKRMKAGRQKVEEPEPEEDESGEEAPEPEEDAEEEASDDEAGEEAPEEEETEGDEEEGGEEESEFGEDVTENFARAEAKKVKVFKSAKGHTVVSEDDPETPLHRKPIGTRKDVTKFISTHRKK